jgi:SH3 domain protein
MQWDRLVVQERELNNRTHARLATSLATLVLVLGLGDIAQAEQGWVRSEIRLNLRTGPSTENRIVGVAKTGDGVDILERGDKWTKIRLRDDPSKQGWIPVGYLKPEPPPTIRLAQIEERAASLESELVELKESAAQLRQDNSALASQDDEQQANIKQLTMENMELRAGARYPEWITGASIFAAGMMLGAILHRSSARRQPSRIRL